MFLYINSGLITASILSLSVLGLALMVRITKFFNIAFGEFMTTGAFLTYWFNAVLGMDILTSAFLGILLTAIIGAFIYTIVFRPFHEKKSSSLTLLVVSVGVSNVIRNVILTFSGPDPKQFNIPMERGIDFGPFLFTRTQLIIIALSITILICIHLVLKYTNLGRMMRAVADNLELAKIRGINPNKIYVWTWFVCCGLAGISGVMLGITSTNSPDMGILILLNLFACLIIGGIENPYGAVAGALIIGLSMEIIPGFVDTAFDSAFLFPYKPAIAYIFMIILLLVKPQGLFAKNNSTNLL